jgi:GxxExxY protein
MGNIILKDEFYQIIGAAMEVYNQLGRGILEPIYQEALALEFTNRSIPYQREKPINTYYKGIQLQKQYIADFLCFDKIIVELKSVVELNDFHRSQLLNYLRLTKMKGGLLLNYGQEKLIFETYVN